MSASMTSGLAEAAGADLYYERRGDGPPLLMITGGGGDGGYYADAADILASDYTVITYDRRGNSRSPLHGDPVMISLAGQSDDAVAVLAANGFGSARIFGNSGGASIALDLAARHPQVTEAVVAHEPPVPLVLDDPREFLADFEEIEHVLATEGWQAAFMQFQIKIGLLPPARPELLAFLLKPASYLPPGPRRDAMIRTNANWPYMLRYEVRPFIDFRPDLDKIVSSQVKIALACGTATRDKRAVEISDRTAALLGTECVRFSGGHTAPTDMPRTFAPELAALLTHLAP